MKIVDPDLRRNADAATFINELAKAAAALLDKLTMPSKSFNKTP